MATDDSKPQYADASLARRELAELRTLVQVGSIQLPAAQQRIVRGLWTKLETVLQEIIAYVEANRR